MTTMQIHRDLAETIGNTPLIRLRRASEETGCEILGKAEFMNPGGSVKDRIGIAMIEAAERAGRLKPGGVIVEGTAGNTGIGLAMVGHALGHRTIIVMPENQSREKIDTLKQFGAEVRLIPAVPYKNPKHFVHTSGRLAQELNEASPDGAFWANQFENLSNRAFHEQTTGPEIWEQMEGRIDVFVAGIGTGGTVSGVGRYLKEQKPGVQIVAVEPKGSPVISTGTGGKHKIQGIGAGFVPDNYHGDYVDSVALLTEEDAAATAKELASK